MKKVVVLTTGGTIATKFDQKTQGMLPVVSGNDLIGSVPELTGIAELEVIEFSNSPSSGMTPAKMLDLAKLAEKQLLRNDVSGVVVTHGTDTLEETAYAMDLYHDSSKPVCITGAMRNMDEISSDAPNNLLGAITAASSDSCRDSGVLVVMNDEIHAAAEVTKTHSANRATFASPFWGPLGVIDDSRAIIRRKSINRKTVRPQLLKKTEIPLIKCYTGQDSDFINFYLEKGMDGIVLEGFGRGNIPNKIVPGVEKLINAGIPVVIATRVTGGRVQAVYSYTGGLKHLETLSSGKIIEAGELNGQKARLMLMFAINTTGNNKLKAYFD